MDFHLKQWRNQQHESDLQQHQQQQQQQHSSAASAALPLFVPEPPNNTKLSNLSAIFPDLTPTSTRFPRMANHFSLAQWQELELQALIFRYMLAGAAVPAELLQPIKKSLLTSPSYYLHTPLHHYPHYQPALLQSGYWGRTLMDPEPGRCRRTDGKKWRCSRDVVVGQKYCERHVHRGRNRSRKPVEIPTPLATAMDGGNGGAGSQNFKTPTAIAASPSMAADGTFFALSGPSSSTELLQLSQSTSAPNAENRSLFEFRDEKVSGDGRSDGRVLRCFFNDWPRSMQKSDNAGSPRNSATCLSMSIPGNSSDISLKLSTGTGDEPGGIDGNIDRERPHINWANGWGSPAVSAPMGGPLAEALRSSRSNSNSSPKSVLHELPRGSASKTSYVSS